MLAVNHYAQVYIDGGRARVNVQLSTYRDLVTAARNQVGADEEPLDTALGSFEPVFYNNMVLILDSYFVHRTRNIEGKDGSPLNEVRMLCNSMMHNNDVMSADRTIKYDPARSVLKYEVGDEIKLDEADFLLMFEAFIADLEGKFLATSSR